MLPAAAYDKSVKFESSDESVAAVDENGKVTALAAGNAVITATTADGKYTATAEISVVKYAESIEPYKTEYSLKTGEKEKIQYVVIPDDATEKNVSFRSSDESVATVSAEGVITAIGNGTANITLEIPGTDVFATVSVAVAEAE